MILFKLLRRQHVVVATMLAFLFVSPVLALENGQNPRAPKQEGIRQQSPARYLRYFLRPSKSEAPVNFGVFQLPGSVAWATKTSVYITTWIATYLMYNLANRRALDALRLPWLQSLICVGSAAPVSLLLWLFGLRSFPSLSFQQMRALHVPSFLHAVSNVASSLTFASGDLGLAHVLHTLHAPLTALFSGVLGGYWQPWPVFLAYLPVVCGAGVACLQDAPRHAYQIAFSLLAGTAFALRTVLGRRLLSGAEWNQSRLPAPSLLSLLQLGSSLLTLPAVLLLEGAAALSPPLHPNWQAALGQLDHVGTAVTDRYLWTQLAISGLALQGHYEAGFFALEAVSARSHATANNVKRVLAVLSSYNAFGTAESGQSLLAGAVALAGAFLHSLLAAHYAAVARAATY